MRDVKTREPAKRHKTSRQNSKKRFAISLILALTIVAGLPLGVYAVQNIFTGFGTVKDIQFAGSNIDQVVYQGETVWERGQACENIAQTGQSTQSFNYTGNPQTFTASASGCYRIELWGAMGGSYSNAYKGGAGGYVSGVIHLNQNDALYVYLGGAGIGGGVHTPRAGGYNGGGNATSDGDRNTRQASGAGASDVRLVGGNWDNALSLSSRIIVAGGGGGGTGNAAVSTSLTYGGAGGGLIGINSGTSREGKWSGYGTGGTQTKGGSPNDVTTVQFGTFGKGSNSTYSGGGSGYYGGGSSMSAGGGSSYISGHTGSVAITSAANQTPKSGCATSTTDNSCSIHYSGKIFLNTKMIDGTGYAWTNVKGALELMPNPTSGTYASGTGHPGNGAAKITYLGFNN